jgi:hypothetical protein
MAAWWRQSAAGANVPRAGRHVRRFASSPRRSRSFAQTRLTPSTTEYASFGYSAGTRTGTDFRPPIHAHALFVEAGRCSVLRNTNFEMRPPRTGTGIAAQRRNSRVRSVVPSPPVGAPQKQAQYPKQSGYPADVALHCSPAGHSPNLHMPTGYRSPHGTGGPGQPHCSASTTVHSCQLGHRPSAHERESPQRSKVVVVVGGHVLGGLHGQASATG